MVRHAESTVDQFLRKESFAVLAKMGYAKEEARRGPHKYHGIAARTRLSVAGKRTTTTTAQHRHQHHKERVTIQQVNDLAEIGRDIESFTKAGRRVPVAVWEKYDRLNKRHKKHEAMTTVAADMQETQRRKVIRARPEREVEEGGGRESTLPEDDSYQSDSETLRSPSTYLKLRRRSERYSRAVVGSRCCTFGSGRGDGVEQRGALHPAGTSTTIPTRSRSSPWGLREREKLNELYWEIGRPPHRGADTAREHFHRYSQRHCMLFPHRSPAEVVERLKIVFRYNTMKEPNEREHWLRLNASKGFLPATTTTTTTSSADPTGAAHFAAISSRNFATSSVAAGAKFQPPATIDESSMVTELKASSTSPLASVTGPATATDAVSAPVCEPLFRGSGGMGAASTASGGGLLSTTAASYASEAIAAASIPFAHSSPRRSRAHRAAATSPFYDPIRPSSPSWGFGEALDSSYSGCCGDSRGDGVRRGGGSRGSSRVTGREGSRPSGSRGGNMDEREYDDNKPEETELLDYTSLGPQTASNRATSPAHSFSRDGLGADNSGMFQADKRPEPGPGSFRPNLSATSTHPSPRCGVFMGHLGSGGGGGDGVGDNAAGGGREAALRPGPGQYSTWDSIGRQILSTRPSSPIAVFGTGEWELR